ncbi:RNA 2',3'-cyclic phosphodiesterase [Marinobacter sp.]|uniref:RNA 2',3'-cyclic phosphodiesterase n=1 Tax=Marinobacter sp. TaxID=50741 RepID=UPI00384F621E
MQRLFIGLELPELIMRQLLAMRQNISGARWQTANQLHLTLCFIGNASEETTRNITAALLTLESPAFDLTLEKPGYFGPQDNPRALWLGVNPESHVAALHDQVEIRLMQVGIARDERSFTPHVTLARMAKDSGPADAFLQAFREYRSPAFRVQHISLFRSTVTHEGSTYDVVRRFPLEG